MKEENTLELAQEWLSLHLRNKNMDYCKDNLADKEYRNLRIYLRQHGLELSSLRDDDFISTLIGSQRDKTIDEILYGREDN
jgi:hypothetical protein